MLDFSTKNEPTPCAALAPNCVAEAQVPTTIEQPSLYDALRSLAARNQCHHFFITNKCHPNSLIRRALRHGNVITRPFLEAQSEWLFPRPVEKKLDENHGAVMWSIDGSKAPQTFINEMRNINLQTCVSIPFYNGRGACLRLTLADIKIHHGSDFLTQLTHEADRFFRTYQSDLISKQESILKPRERDCLQWAAAGKTSIETASILTLSVHTVNQYLTNAAERLGASNRVHAVAKALNLGLINAPE